MKALTVAPNKPLTVALIWIIIWSVQFWACAGMIYADIRHGDGPNRRDAGNSIALGAMFAVIPIGGPCLVYLVSGFAEYGIWFPLPFQPREDIK
jgi:hypothetical protein